MLIDLWRALWRHGVVLLPLLGLSCLVFPQAAAASDGLDEAQPWQIGCFDCPHRIRDYTPQAAQVDSRGVAHVVYGGDALYHAWAAEGGWQVEVADASPRVGRFAALAIDALDQLHVVYLDDSDLTLRYALRTATGCAARQSAPHG